MEGIVLFVERRMDLKEFYGSYALCDRDVEKLIGNKSKTQAMQPQPLRDGIRTHVRRLTPLVCTDIILIDTFDMLHVNCKTRGISLSLTSHLYFP